MPFAVGLWIGGAYFFTSSTSFANPAVTIARTLSDSFAGIDPSSAPMFVAMQLVGEINRCSWCIDYGRSLATKGMREKIMHVSEFDTYAGFTEAERAALRYAAEATRSPVEVSDETFAVLKRHYNDKQVVELTFAVAIEGFFNRVIRRMGFRAAAKSGDDCGCTPPGGGH